MIFSKKTIFTLQLRLVTLLFDKIKKKIIKSCNDAKAFSKSSLETKLSKNYEKLSKNYKKLWLLFDVTNSCNFHYRIIYPV